MAKKNYRDQAEQILQLVGRQENITTFLHCITRLRFEVKDKSIIKEEELKMIKGILGVRWMGEQLQVIIGADVADVYLAICEIGGVKPNDEIELDEEVIVTSKSISEKISNFFKPVVDCIIPLMGLFVATGLIKGILSALTVFELILPESGTYIMLYALSDSLLYFFPIFIGFNCGKVFKTNQFITAAIGATLLYPTITAAQTAGTPIDFMGIPVVLISYVSSILPVIIASYFAAKIEKIVTKIVPNVVKFMLVPTITLLLIVPMTFLGIGPVMTIISDAIGAFITFVWDIAPALGGFVIGGFWQVLVMTGLHGGTMPFVVGLLTQNGYDILGICVTSSMIALGGVALAMWVRTKQVTKKDIAFSAMISSLLGVTEPALYGVVLPHGKAFACAWLGGGFGGMLGAVLGVKVYGFGGNGLLQLPFTISPDGMGNTYLWIFAVVVAFTSSFILAYVLCKKDFCKGI